MRSDLSLADPVDTAPVQAGPGRKAKQVAECAWRMFFERGFQATSMDAIAREAAVSKATLYAYYPSKEALFASLVRAECCAMAAAIGTPELGDDLPSALRAFARQYVRLYLDRDPKRAAFFHLIMAEGSRFPELGRLFVDRGLNIAADRVAGLLDRARERGMIKVPDTQLAAQQFLSLVKADLPLRLSLGCPTPAADEIERLMDGAITLFLRGYGVVLGAAPAGLSPAKAESFA